MAPWVRTALVAGVAAVTGGVVGAVLRGSAEDPALDVALLRRGVEIKAAESARSEAEALRAERDRLRAELEAARETAKRGAAVPAPVPAPAEPPPQAPSGAVAKLALAAREAIDRRDGVAALAAVRELAAIVPEGQVPAMSLAVEIYAAENLGIGDASWSGFLSSPAMTSLLAGAIGKPSPEGFRELAAEVLPDLAPRETVAPLFREALKSEKDEDVARAMVEGLIRFAEAEDDPALLEILADGKLPVPVRVQVATHLSLSTHPKVRTALVAAAEGAPAALAAGIKALLAPAKEGKSGFLVAGFVDGSLRLRGIEVGDLLLTYDGQPAEDGLNAAIGAALGREGTVKVELLRSGATQTVDMKPGWPGLIGRIVHVVEER